MLSENKKAWNFFSPYPVFEKHKDLKFGGIILPFFCHAHLIMEFINLDSEELVRE